MTPIPVDTDNFRVEAEAGGIAQQLQRAALDIAQWLAAIREKRAPQFGRGA